MNLQQVTTEDQILDNYVALWRQVIGDKRLVVTKPRGSKSTEMKQLWKKELRTCECGVTFYPNWYYKKYCGSRDEGGCARKKYLEGIKKSLKKRWQK